MNLLFVKSALAASQPPPPQGGSTNLGTLEGLGPLGTVGTDLDKALGLFSKVLSSIIGIMTVIAGIWFIFQFLSGALGWLTAGSDKAGLENAQKRMTSGIIGLAMVVAAIFIIDLIGSLLGLDILSPGKIVGGLW